MAASSSDSGTDARSPTSARHPRPRTSRACRPPSCACRARPTLPSARSRVRPPTRPAPRRPAPSAWPPGAAPDRPRRPASTTGTRLLAAAQAQALGQACAGLPLAVPVAPRAVPLAPLPLQHQRRSLAGREHRAQLHRPHAQPHLHRARGQQLQPTRSAGRRRGRWCASTATGTRCPASPAAPPAARPARRAPRRETAPAPSPAPARPPPPAAPAAPAAPAGGAGRRCAPPAPRACRPGDARE